MLLSNLILMNEHEPASISISGEKIMSVENPNETIAFDNINIHFTDAIAFPGLINSHDHLDFNCFSPLGNKTYSNYTEWGNHIHTNYKQDINAVLKIPQPLRTAWGMYKNLLAGVTTVINHGDVLTIENPLIEIYQQTQNLHSVKFQKNWKWKLNNPFIKSKTCVIHTGEGTDEQSADEIDELLQWNLFNRKLIGIHGVAMNPAQAKRFEGLVWCPESNKILLNKHADIKNLSTAVKIVFGTDSTLTGNWNVWQHLRLARSLKLVSDDKLFSMITSAASELWGFNKGELLPGKDADLVIAKTNNGLTAWDNLFAVNPSTILLVMQKGKIRLFDETLFEQISNLKFNLPKYSQVNMNGVIKYVEGNVPALINAIRNYNPSIVLPADFFETTKKPVND